jgi:uncharacterized membrane protein YhhN
VELFASWQNRREIRRISKSLIMPSLLALYLASHNTFFPFVAAAAVCGWLGDVFLLQKSMKWFALGLLCFLAGHIFYANVLLRAAGTVNRNVFIITGIFALAVVLATIRIIKPNRRLKAPMTVYCDVIMFMSLSALQLLIQKPGAASAACMTGSVLFMFSDFYLGYYTFRPHGKHHEFVVMLPYMLAQVLLIGGLATF